MFPPRTRDRRLCGCRRRPPRSTPPRKPPRLSSPSPAASTRPWRCPSRTCGRWTSDTPGTTAPISRTWGARQLVRLAGGVQRRQLSFARALSGVGLRFDWLSPDEDTTRPARYIAAPAFRLILLPEPIRLDAAQAPELSWLKLPFYVGQRAGFRNPPGTEGWCGRPPLQPAARAEWRGPPPQARWSGRIEAGADGAGAHDWPADWTPLSRPPS
jgi:hypothetical protein